MQPAGRRLMEGCSGANDGNCYPYVMWSSTPNTQADYYRGHYLDGGHFYDSPGGPHRRMSYSVRCVQALMLCRILHLAAYIVLVILCLLHVFG